MSQAIGAKTKGIIKNNRTGEVKKLQFNPTEHDYSRGVSYATIDAPGMMYPETQYIKGNIRTFSSTLMFFDKPASGLFREWTVFLGGFLTPERNYAWYSKPPEMTFVLGSWARVCVLEDLDIHVIEYDETLSPTHFECTLSLRQVGT